MSAFAVTRYAPREHLASRVCLALLLLYASLELKRFSGQPAPVGFARWIDLSFVVGPLYWLFFGASLVALVAYAAGRALPLALSYLSLFWIAFGTLRNSQGAIGHSEQLFVMVLVAQTLAHVGSTRFVQRLGFKSSHAASDLAFHYSKQMVVAVYVIAGITKLIATEGAWFDDAPNLAVSMVKAAYQEYYNHLEPGVREIAVERAAFMLTHKGLTRVLFGLGLLTELLALLALWNRFSALVVGVVLVVFHESVRVLMSIHFYYNVWVIVIFLVNAPGWLLLLRQRSRRPAG